MPGGPPTWFRMIVVCGKARARSASSISCGWYSQASKVRFSSASRANPARQVASAIWPFVAFVRPRENISLGSQTTEWRDAAEAAVAGSDLRLQYARHAVAEAQVGMP